MKIRFLNKSVEPQRFRYNPMYYNERKERLEKKKAHYRKLEDTEASEDERREFYKSSMQDSWSRAQYRQTEQKSSNIRVLILIVLIVLLGYFIFNGIDEVDTVVDKLW